MYGFACYVLYLVTVGIHGSQEEYVVRNILNEITALKTRQNSCDKKVSELEAVVDELQRRNDKLDQELLEMRDDKIISTENYDLQSQAYVDKVTRHKSLHKRTPSSQVAFTAGVSSADLTDLGYHHTIIFDYPITNIGNAYNHYTGIFQAPLKGVYVFTLTLMVIPRNTDYLELVLDGNIMFDILADASSVDGYVSSTKQCVLNLNVGSVVWIRTSSTGKVREIHGNMHTTFSGFLLFET
ncbi:complement C1q tumor necrosis factor-related protein 3-like [Ruditapes philippinarum]|uniref:complement C1q tumor necrosis factor-related protein 3-like n=1 Tax=Ruditapes philippinarum TaxID=129788 RepID=UPI00295B148C|nr:complement C1q tumor necrosis factor-related protein 3-like [Ruditapes philippinarum]